MKPSEINALKKTLESNGLTVTKDNNAYNNKIEYRARYTLRTKAVYIIFAPSDGESLTSLIADEHKAIEIANKQIETLQNNIENKIVDKDCVDIHLHSGKVFHSGEAPSWRELKNEYQFLINKIYSAIALRNLIIADLQEAQNSLAKH